jgi:hypothetical protein
MNWSMKCILRLRHRVYGHVKFREPNFRQDGLTSESFANFLEFRPNFLGFRL